MAEHFLSVVISNMGQLFSFFSNTKVKEDLIPDLDQGYGRKKELTELAVWFWKDAQPDSYSKNFRGNGQKLTTEEYKNIILDKEKKYERLALEDREARRRLIEGIQDEELQREFNTKEQALQKYNADIIFQFVDVTLPKLDKWWTAFSQYVYGKDPQSALKVLREEERTWQDLFDEAVQGGGNLTQFRAAIKHSEMETGARDLVARRAYNARLAAAWSRRASRS